MQKMLFIKLMICFVLLVSVALPVPAVELREFADAEQEQRFNNLAKELRCLVCQNQSLADSDAELAKDLREQIFTMLQDGASDQDIIDFMVARYGDFVLYNPPVKDTTLLLWFGPFIFVSLATLVLVIYLLKRADAKQPDVGNAEERQKRIQAMMDSMDKQATESKRGKSGADQQ